MTGMKGIGGGELLEWFTAHITSSFFITPEIRSYVLS